MAFRGAPKGQAEEMVAFVDLMRDRQPTPESDFRLSLWSSLTTLKLATSMQTSLRMQVSPSTPALAEALGVGVSLSVSTVPVVGREPHS